MRVLTAPLLGSLALLCFGHVFAQSTDNILINEFQPNPPGEDPSIVEFELSGPASTAFTGWILSFESDAGTSVGLVDRAAMVTGVFDANGLLAVSVPDLENPSFTVVLTSEFTGSVGSSTVTDTALFGTVYDAIGVPDAASDEANLFGVQLGGSDFSYTGAEPELIFRDASTGGLYAVDSLTGTQVQDINADLVDVDRFDATPFAVTLGAVNPSLDDGGGNPGGGIAFGACGDQTESKIHLVQGNGSASPLVDTEVVIEGVVVGTFQSDPNGNSPLGGYFVQEEDIDVDADASTSEGIFVFDSDNIASVGDVVRVAGSVTEFFDLTELVEVSDYAICSTSGIASATPVTLPLNDADELEAVEGMLVSLAQTLYVTDHFTLGRFGEVELTSDVDRLFNPTQITEPGLLAIAQQMENDLARIQIDDGLTTQNPVPVPPYFAADGTLRAGDSTTGLLGVMSYGFGSYEIQPVQSVNFVRENGRPAAPDSVAGSLTVASFNVLNYFTTLTGSGSICGPNSNLDCRGADSASEFTRQKDKIVNALAALDADIVGLIEIENDVNSVAIADLVAALPGYSFIDTGPIGTDAIKVALIYKSSVIPEGDFAVLDSTIDPIFIDDKNRPVLIQTFKEVANGEVFTVAVNHFKSKGSDCDDLGDPDTGDGQGNCNITRTNAATALVNYLATDPTGSGDSDFLVIGDLNAYAMEDPIMALESASYTNLVLADAGATEHSFSFDGQFGTLDYALSSDSLTSQIGGVTVWQINSDEPRALDYNDFNQASLYNNNQFRSSDHDPILVGLNLAGDQPPGPACNGLPATIVADSNGGRLLGTSGADVIVGSAARDIILGLGGDDVICSGDGNDTVYAGWGSDTVFAGQGADTVFGQRGNDTLYGEEGRDRIFGGNGDDVISGGPEFDRLFGGRGNDQINQD